MTLVVDKVLEDQLAQGVNALVQTVAYNVKLVRGIDSEIKDLTSDIETFSARLIEASKNSWASDHQVLRVVVKKFRNVVNEAQDTIADYVSLKGKHVDNFFSKSLDKIPFCGKINDFASEIQSIRAKLAMIRQDHGQELLHLMKCKINEQNKGLLTLQVRPTIEENNVFGFEKDLAIIKDRFIHAYANFIVIPIVGITGSGKTILASMIFEEQKRHEKFNIWVNVSQGFDRKQKFIDIIYQITNLREDISIMTEEGLAREICELLKEKKYFVVLDDVRKKEDWDSFKVALPTNLEGSRVLVTSPYGNVVDSNWKSHNLGTLSNEEGWLLLENSAFGTEKCNEKSIKNLGKEIANKCNELPLALVAVGGMLRQCRNIADWQRVAENPFLEINGEGQIYRDRVKMTYNDLPNEKLKNCFLYFACFPMGHEIVVWKLIRLWIAEEFIPTIDEQGYALDAEVEAQKYLNDHVDRNLVRVVKQRINGQIKTCCIHNTLHEFCKSEAARINLFHVMDEGQRLDENTSSTPLENISSIRRLCFHSFTENKFDVFVKSYDQKRSLCPFGKHIHSLLLFSSQKGEVYFTEDKLLEIIANTFPLLRVLNIEFSNKLKFQRNELYNLHLLKYLAVKGNLGSLPKSLKNLRGLETLVIETTSRELQIDEGIWNMKKLRHVRTNVSMQLPFPPKRSATDSGGKNIRTLSTVLPKSCTEEIFRKTPNLQKLCVRGDLSEFLNKSKRSVFFKMLKCLENLKLYGKCDKVLMLPRFEQAPRLKRLTFSGTVFKWKDIIILGSLEELEVLKLDDYAFKGEVCDLRSNNIVFKRLQYLRIGRTNLVIWKVAQNNFPALQSLVLRNCSSLKSIPEAFANVHTLEVMELLDMSESAVQSAKEVKEKFTNRGFQLQLDITSKMGKGPMTAGTDTEAVKRLVRYVEWSAGPTGLYSELKDVSLDIEMINARLQDAYKNSIGPVNVFIVKNFQTIVNEAKDVAREYGFLTMKYEDKTLTKFLEPLRYRRNVKSCASKIQSVRSKMRTICEQYEYDLLSLTINRNNVLLTPQIETRIGFDDKVIEIENAEEAVNKLVQTVRDNVNHIMESEIEDMTSQIETFRESLVVVCKSPMANEHCVLSVIVNKFERLVNEANDAVANYFAQEKKHGLAKAFDKIRLCGKLNNAASEILSIKEKAKIICEDHKEDLRHLWEYNKHSDQPPLKIETPIGFDKVIEKVEEAVNMLVQTVEDNVNLVSDIMESEIEGMISQIKTFTESLVVACKNPQASEHRLLRLIVKKFGTHVDEARDAVAKCYFAQEKKHGLAKAFDKIRLCGKLNNVASEIQSIKEKVKTICEDYNDLRHLWEDYNEHSDLPPLKVCIELRENKILGFEEDLKTIKIELMGASQDFSVIQIVGNAGTGKTTFASQIFEDSEIRNYFTHFVWVNVSRGFHRKQKFIDILHQISGQTGDFDTDNKLEDKVKELLEDQRYFIILDDVQKKEDWESFEVLFPKNLKGSRVLVTTLSGNVVDSTWKSHSLGKLSNDNGWLVIKNNVFGTTEESVDTLFKELGIKIAEKCNTLPHALVLVAGILRHCLTAAGWQRVADLEINGEGQIYRELVELSYKDLPDENLKKCFLYFACFPMGHEIVAWKLICLWIAEGFIPTEDEWGSCLDKEVEASKYLNVLVDRNLVMVKKKRADGKIKTCCIHDTLHEFCRSEAETQELFHVMDEGQRLDTRIDLSRLCSYYTMNIFDVENNPPDSFFNLFNKRMGALRQDGDSVGSLLLSSSQKSEIHSTPEQLETILKTFQYLDVLNIESLKFSSLPNELYSQCYISYLAITADITSLPKSFENLSWLETLVIKTTKMTLQINGGIWNMEKLRHVHTNTSTQLPSPPKTGKHDRNQTDIRTLSTISPGSCTNEIFNMTPKLQKLGVRGKLSELLLLEKKQNVCLFNNLQMLECLENLKLHGKSEEVKLKVPMLDKFPRRLKKLTLSGTLFQWNDMTVLGLLEKLKVLKLDDNAFSGEHWDLSSDVNFKRLQYLRIRMTNLKTWKSEVKKSFPVLESLVLRNCISLEKIPQDFANVDSLELMEVFDVSEKVADFAREICVKRHGKINVKINGFITHLPSQETVHNVEYEKENVNTSEFDYPSTSILSQEIEHNQAYGDENVNTNGFEHPSTSTLSEEIVHKQSNEEENNVNTNEFDQPSTSTLSQEIVSADD